MPSKSLEQFLRSKPKKGLAREFTLAFIINVVIVGAFFYGFAHSQYVKSISVREVVEENHLELMRFSMARDLKILVSDLRVLAHSDALAQYVMRPSGENLHLVQDRVSIFASDRKMYDQIRYIDISGQELVRVDYENEGIRIAKETTLQNKKDRYYFKQTIKMAKGHFYISPLDLNVENGVIEYPYNPVLRIATPIFNQSGTPDGILILNYRAQLMLDQFSLVGEDQSSTCYSLLNAKGYWLKADRKEKEWGFMLGHGESFALSHPLIWQSVQNSDDKNYRDETGIFVFSKVNLLEELGITAGMAELGQSSGKPWYLVAHVKANELGFLPYLLRYQNLSQVVTISLLLLVIVSWILASLKVQQKNANKSLQLLSKGLEQSPAAVIITDKEGEISYVNPKFEQMSGHKREDVIGENPRMFKSGKTDNKTYSELWTTIKNGQTWEGDFENKDQHDRPYFVSAQISPIHNGKGVLEHFVGIQEDVTEKIELQRQLEKIASTDSLTGIFNRGHFMLLAAQEIKRRIRYGHPLSILLFDLDYFKDVNDTYGHHSGDKVLQDFTQCIEQELRDSDIFGRLGGEEFAAIIVDTQRAETSQLAERLRQKIEDLEITSDDHLIRVTVSIGCTEWQEGDLEVEDILKRADKALYRAKEGGRNRVTWYS